MAKRDKATKSKNPFAFSGSTGSVSPHTKGRRKSRSNERQEKMVQTKKLTGKGKRRN
jgi:hypothetical protein